MATRLSCGVLAIALLFNIAHVRAQTTQTLTKYLVSVQKMDYSKNPLGTGHFCTGALVSSRFVVTAAICIKDKNQVETRSKRLQVVAGTPNRLVRDVTTKKFYVDKVIPHAPFDWRTRHHNIAMLRLMEAAPQNIRAIKVISLIHMPPVIGANCTVVGWHRLYQYGPLAAKAVNTTLTIMPHAVCRDFYRENYYEDSMLCAMPVKNTKKNTCHGDIGAPLICQDLLAGIVSRTTDCGSGGTPIIFTDIHAHEEWIHDINAADRFQSAFKIIVALMLVYVTIAC